MTYPKLDEAILFAAHAHAGTERDGEAPLPYITHPMAVLVNLRVLGGEKDEDLLCAAALHDTLEDTATTAEEIEARFGKRVRGLVQALTRHEPSSERTTGMTKDEIWQLRADILLQEIRKMAPEVQRVKLADRLDNVWESKRTKSPKKAERYVRQTRKILDTIPHEVAPALWDAIAREIAGGEVMD